MFCVASSSYLPLLSKAEKKYTTLGHAQIMNRTQSCRKESIFSTNDFESDFFSKHPNKDKHNKGKKLVIRFLVISMLKSTSWVYQIFKYTYKEFVFKNVI